MNIDADGYHGPGARIESGCKQSENVQRDQRSEGILITGSWKMEEMEEMEGNGRKSKEVEKSKKQRRRIKNKKPQFARSYLDKKTKVERDVDKR